MTILLAFQRSDFRSTSGLFYFSCIVIPDPRFRFLSVTKVLEGALSHLLWSPYIPPLATKVKTNPLNEGLLFLSPANRYTTVFS